MEDIKDMYKRFYKMWRQKQNEWKKMRRSSIEELKKWEILKQKIQEKWKI